MNNSVSHLLDEIDFQMQDKIKIDINDQISTII